MKTRLNPTVSAKKGQAGLVAVAVTLMIALVLAGSTISGLSWMQARRMVVTRQTLQTHYVAQAGIQEAIATRMVPRSNYQSFATTAPPVPAVYPTSGLVFRDPQLDRQLIGVYRYLIVGGDPSRRADGNYYGIPPGPPFSVGANTTQDPVDPVPRLVTFQTSPPTSPFYIVSTGTTCKSMGGAVGVDQFVNSPLVNPRNPKLIGTTPACKPGYTLEEITLITRVSLEEELPGRKDRLNQAIVVKDKSAIRLPGPAFIPGRGWSDTFSFEQAWRHSTAANSPARPTRVVFFEFGPNKIYEVGNLTLNASRTTIANRIPASASVMLYFDGPVDYRSLSIGGAATRYSKDLAGCKGPTSLTSCAIRLFRDPPLPGVGGTHDSGMTMWPIMPYLTKVLLLAPLESTGNVNRRYEIRINQPAIKSYSMAPAGTNGNYTIAFTTCPSDDGNPGPGPHCN